MQTKIIQMDSSNISRGINASGSATRQLPSWIDAFIDYTAGHPSPPLFRKWSAITAIAGALERKLWVRTMGSNLYPNMYVIFVAPPGVGKTIAISTTERLWRGLEDHHVAPTSVTKASLIDSLNDAKRRVMRPAQIPPFVEFNSLKIIAGELGVLIPAYDNDFMNTLTGIYDGYPYAERRRSKDLKLGIDAPQLNILGATTPSYLNAFMPEGAWDQGFISRTLLVYNAQQERKDLFTELNNDEGAMKVLQSDLKHIGELYGKCDFSPDAAAAIGAWHMDGGPPIPDHPKLAHYLTRRTAHCLKLSMVAAAGRKNFAYVIELEDYQRALGWLLEIETAMPDIFRSMNSGGDGAAIDDTWYFVWTTFAKEKMPVAEHRIIHFLKERVPSHSINKVLDVMVQSNMLKKTLSTTGSMVYTPAPKQQF